MSINLPPEFITAGIWLWESFSKDLIKNLASSTKKKVEKEWERFEWALAAKDYRERIYELYSTMRILGNPLPVPLEGIYTDVHLLDKPTAYKRHNIENLKASYSASGYISELNGKKSDALDLIQKKRRLFVLGKPGAGKTTLLKHITLLAAKGIINKVPIFISLNDWSQQNQGPMSQHDLVSYIVRQFEICSFPDAQLFLEEALLKKGRAIILFDGLDEVNEENQLRNQVIRLLRDFTNQYSNNMFVITCRVAATDYAFENFPYVEIADFTKEQITIFVRKWFSSFPEKGERFLRDINQTQNEGLYELAQTPILLSLLCINFDETLSFPTRKNEIFQEAIEALLRKWDSSRNIKRDEIYHGLSPLRKRQLLSRIAAEYFQQGDIFFTSDDIAQRIQNHLKTLPEMQTQTIDGSIVLRAMEAQHGILVERARGVHSFSHLSLQEYFTSQYIVEHTSEKILQQLMEYQQHTGWYEIFLMVAGALPNADLFFSIFSKKQKSTISRLESIKQVRDRLPKTSNRTPVQRLLALTLTVFYANIGLNRNKIENIYKNLSDLLSVVEESRGGNIREELSKIKSTCLQLSRKAKRLLPSRQNLLRARLIDNYLDQIQRNLSAEEDVFKCLGVAGQINDLILQVPIHLDELDKRHPLSRSKVALQIEKRSVVDILTKTQKELKIILDCFNELDSQLGTDLSNWKQMKPLEQKPIEQFQDYLYISLLFLECLNVSAVSDRHVLISKSFLL